MKNANTTTSLELDAMLAQEIAHLNRDTKNGQNIKPAVIIAQPEPNTLNDAKSANDDSSSDEFEEDLYLRDPELFRTTERNRQILLDNDFNMQSALDFSPAVDTNSTKRPSELVFTDPTEVLTLPDRVIVSFSYGHAPEKFVKKSRKYLIAYDFGDESIYATQWSMGTLLRSGDEIHLANVIHTDKDIAELNPVEKKRLWQALDRNSKRLMSKVREILGTMLLYNISIKVHVMAGPVKEMLLDLISSFPVTMVICGARDRGAFKGMLMGSVSTSLIHSSPSPVALIRPQKKTKKSKRQLTPAQKLSYSVRSGHLKVDEIEKVETTIPSINSRDAV
ncbi:uncharacterized protein BYT42DRAFT_583781 [Radiomyces spectabilis]|uniref:uncharacterized protein n=1 Tax=Radiomyces spectabilis TaxID=64574 RepID=UPI00221EFD6E|nr:uncharacterized protein BYT42DRAFT_583781 [Radiomyces spectabilis]KAI8369280.1 hypothetical protein BYT42DRAFT_583781 [Radiomyces spectabilis]